MTTPSNQALRGTWRRRLFWAWIVAAAAVAAYIALGGPITTYVGEGKPLVASKRNPR
jgi:anti-sigma-K factor RskA